MRVGIICFGEPVHDRLWLFTSCSLAKQYVANGTHERVTKKVIRELAPHCTPKPSPTRFLKTKFKVIPASLLPPLLSESNLCLSYPPKDESSYAKANFERVWGNTANMGNPIPPPRMEKYKVVAAPTQIAYKKMFCVKGV